MKKTAAVSIGVLAIALCAAIAGALLRTYQLTDCMDAQGLLIAGGPVMLITAATLGAFVLVMAILCTRLNRLPGSDSCFSKAAGYMLVSTVGGAGVLFGSALRLASGASVASMLIFIVGVLAGLALVIAALLRFNGKKVPFALYVVPIVFLVARLIMDFKDWSTDPVVADFCFLLLTGVSGMVALLNASAFCFGIGKRRATVFWCMAAALFSVLTLPDYLLKTGTVDTARLLITCGVAVWCVSCALQLLRGTVQNEQPPQDKSAEEEPKAP